MSDKDLSLTVGQVTNLQIKPTFEGQPVDVSKISLLEAGSDLGDLITIGAFTAGTQGIVNVPVTAIAAGVKEAVLIFQYADAGVNIGVENWGISTRTVALTITEVVAAALSDVSTPLTMDLWDTQNLTFKVMKGGEDITSSVTEVTVLPASIDGLFEFTSDAGAHTFKSISSSSTEVVTATAKVTVAGTEGGEAYSLEADVVLNTNINDGSIPTNRFDVQFVE